MLFRSVGINYCRIATPAGYNFVTGKSDSLIQAYYQAHIDSLQSHNYEIFGFYGRDEFPEHYYMEQRYKAKLLNYCTVSEGAGGDHRDHFMHHIQPMHMWTGSMSLKAYSPAPFIFKNPTLILNKE